MINSCLIKRMAYAPQIIRMKKTEQILHAAKALRRDGKQNPGLLHLEVHGGVTLAILAEHIIVTRQDGIENDTHQRAMARPEG